MTDTHPSYGAAVVDANAVADAIAAIGRGEIVLVSDDEDRENEGDLVMAAQFCTARDMAFIIRHGCGIVCAPVTSQIAARLDLAPMVAQNDAPLATAFTVSIDVKAGLTTGISATERAQSVRALARPDAAPADFVRPGHMFPLIARDGGVLVRGGHTEAAVDLCLLAGCAPVGVICELANDDGSVMKGAEITEFARSHGLRLISVAALAQYRRNLADLGAKSADLAYSVA